MREIPLTQGKTAIVSDQDFPVLSRFRWSYLKAGTGYACRRERGRMILMHRQILGEPAGSVDHRSGNSLDNRRRNLRTCTHSQNLGNQKRSSRNTSGFKGVSYTARIGKFIAYINCRRVHHHLGCFPTAEAAGRAYDAKAKELFGPFARLNFPEK